MIMNTAASHTNTDSSVTNACKLCAPLGASLVFKGVSSCIPLIHGSQGCATYIRRYLISHYREPVDIASSCFVESDTVFGGSANFNAGLDNLIEQYNPEMIGICTNCLSETIGEDLPRLLRDYRASHRKDNLPALVPVSTPSYSGTHADGFHATVRAILSELAVSGLKRQPGKLNLLPNIVTPAEIRHLRDIVSSHGLEAMILPDYSETLDGGFPDEYRKIPEGGTPVGNIRQAPAAAATIQLGSVLARENGLRRGGGAWLEEAFEVPCHKLPLPIGVNACDAFFRTLEKVSGVRTPEKYLKERSRLLDAYIDGHKYLFGKRAVVYGDEDNVAALAAFLAEIGIIPVLCASGGLSEHFADTVGEAISASIQENHGENLIIKNDLDFDRIFKLGRELKPDIIIGNSKGYQLARELDIPLVRHGFPIHDRVGAQRLMHLGYQGTTTLFDTVANALISVKQDRSPLGYKYI